MLDASREGLEPSFGRSTTEEAFTPPSPYTSVGNRFVSEVATGPSLGAREPNQATLSAETIRDELSRILESSIFAQSRRLSRFLRFTVETTLAREEEMLKEYLIGTEVYQRKPSYDPSEDSIVRSEAYRLEHEAAEERRGRPQQPGAREGLYPQHRRQ